MSSTVIPFDEKFLPAFISLNREWIEKYFVLEAMDLYQLENPKRTILEGGGEIFFVVSGGEALGTCAMVPHGPGSYELAKMAVAPQARGKSYGDLLMEASVTWAKSKGAHEIIILSNTILEPAIGLYKKHGFTVVHLGDHPDYKRCNIELRRLL